MFARPGFGKSGCASCDDSRRPVVVLFLFLFLFFVLLLLLFFLSSLKFACLFGC